MILSNSLGSKAPPHRKWLNVQEMAIQLVRRHENFVSQCPFGSAHTMAGDISHVCTQPGRCRGTTASMSARLAKVAESLTPGKMAEYHRQLARIGVARAGTPRGWREIRMSCGIVRWNINAGRFKALDMMLSPKRFRV